jgi:hypothetical protein
MTRKLTEIPDQPSLPDARRPLGIPNPVLVIDDETSLLVTLGKFVQSALVVEDRLGLLAVEVETVFDVALVGFEPASGRSKGGE